MRKDERGTSIIELLLILLILIILGLLGWYVWQAGKNNTPKSSDASTPSSTPAKKTETEKKPATPPPPAIAYLKITEWGIKFKLTNDIKDAYYDSIVTTNMNAFSLRVHSLDSESDCKTGSQSVVTIFKVGKDEIDDRTDKKYSESDKGVIIGDNFYFIAPAQYWCSEKAESQALLTKVRAAFSAASLTIEKL